MTGTVAAVEAEQIAEQIQNDFAQAVLAGLRRTHKEIPCRYLYDDEGSVLFEKITHTQEYYPTRTEIALLETYGGEIAELIGPGCSLIEFGSGSSRKTKILIESLVDLAAYVPIDISDGALQEAEEKLNSRYPRLTVVPVHADFNKPMDLPQEADGEMRLGFFPGSTIGNFTKDAALSFLRRAYTLLGPKSALVIGVDLKKDTSILEAAYNDEEGVTAAFNLNLLSRINRELDGDIDPAHFAHKICYNEKDGRVEIYIESLKAQTVSVLGEDFDFVEGECIHTENSHKYSLSEFQALAETAGWTSEQAWVDDDTLFSVHFLRRD